jgi:type IX secretion system PorP/SprF family membrane protein
LLFSFLAAFVYSQQKASNTLFEWNRTDFNPAFTGLSITTDINIIMRQQWIGFRDAPKTQYVTSHAYLPDGIGVGGVLYNNVAGPTRQSGIKAAFAKQVSLTRDVKLSMGLSLDVFQNIYDQTRLNTGLPFDPAVTSSPVEQKLAPDASVGAVLFSDIYYVGLSCTNLTESKYDFLSTTSDFSNPIKRTYYFTGGYAFEFNREFRYSPGVLVRKTIGLPLQADISNRFYYNNLIAGLSYRTSNEASVILGVGFAKIYEIAYAYDYSFNPLKSYSTGSHEFLLRFKLPNYNKDDGRGTNKKELIWAL